MPWILALVFAVIGFAGNREWGGLVGFAFGFVFGYTRQLDSRIKLLERRLAELARAPRPDPVAAPPPAVEAEAPAATAPPPAPAPAVRDPWFDGTPARITAPRPAPGAAPRPGTRASLPPDPLTRAFGAAKAYFTTGNVVAKAGVVVLFFGVAFLLKYAAEHAILPIEVRLAAVAAGGLALVAVGWRKRLERAAFALLLQGAGVGVMYLTVFAALRLYHVLPASLAFGLMLGLVAFSALLAILQDARALAVAGSIGGFLAPVLISSGGGSHVALFSYYALLNAGIFAIAWFKAWRILNWLGFMFTFVIATAWGVTSYRPEHFATTEPFLVLFYAFYLVIPVLFARRVPVALEGYVDGTLVFGLPVVGFGLQYGLVRDMEYGAALSALALGGVYLALAATSWKRWGAESRRLPEAQLALGVIFLTLTVPFALAAGVTAATWALEAAGIYWVALHQGRTLARWFALLLQIGAAVAFVAHYDGLRHAGDLPVLNTACLGAAFIAAAGFFTSWCSERYADALPPAERPLRAVLLAWGLGWWYVAGLAEIDRHVAHELREATALVFSSVSLAALARLAHPAWTAMRQASLLHLAIVTLAAGGAYLNHPTRQVLADLGGLAWPLALAVWYGLLRAEETLWPRRAVELGHAGGLWIASFIAAFSASRAMAATLPGASTWAFVAWPALAAAALGALAKFGPRLAWPVVRHAPVYTGLAAGGLAAFLLGWALYACTEPGGATPLPWLPLANPLELLQGVAVIAAALWARRTMADARLPHLPAWALPAIVGGTLFLVANAALGRAVHHLGGVPFDLGALARSPVFEAALAVFWGVTALGVMHFASRRGLREPWFAGAGLLGLLTVKLFLIDLAGTGTIGRIVSFLATGGLMLLIGYLSPLPPRRAGAAP